MRKKQWIISGLLLACLTLTGCPDPVTYPEYPIISFNGFYAAGDVGYITIGFTDGDGDVGLDDSMTSPPFDTSSVYHNNLWIQYWEYNDLAQQWEPGLDLFGDTVVFEYRIPNITPTGKNKALKGTIEVRIEPNYRNENSPYKDSIRYRICLADRNLNKSDWIDTPPIHNGVVVN